MTSERARDLTIGNRDCLVCDSIVICLLLGLLIGIVVANDIFQVGGIDASANIITTL